FGSAFEWSNFGFAKIDADGMVRPAAKCLPVGKAFSDGLGTRIVEPHPIDERLVLHRAEHSRARIAFLRVPGDATQFAKAEAKRLPHRHSRGLFVHSSSQADWIGKAKPKNIDWKNR